MGNEQGVPVRQQPSSPGAPRPKSDYELLIAVRGQRRSGKTTVVARMRGLPFNEEYEATSVLDSTEIIWRSTSNEVVTVTAWDVVERALLPADASEKVERADATTVDTLKRADGLMIMIDQRFEDTITLAMDIITTAPHDLPILIFSGSMDVEDMTPVIPEQLHKFMGRFYFVPGSLKTGQGLVEISKWLELPLIVSKKRAQYNLYKRLEADLAEVNADFTQTAEHYVALESALEHMPKFIPAPKEPEPVSELVAQPEPEAEHEDETEKSFERPYQRRQRSSLGAESSGLWGARRRQQAKVEPVAMPTEPADIGDDAGGFWSDDEGHDAPPPKPKVVLPPSSDDEEVRPNPLVQGRRRAVDLQSSIKQQSVVTEKKMVYVSQQDMSSFETEREAPNVVENDTADDYADMGDYGEIGGSSGAPAVAPAQAPPPGPPAEKVFRKRMRRSHGPK